MGPARHLPEEDFYNSVPEQYLVEHEILEDREAVEPSNIRQETGEDSDKFSCTFKIYVYVLRNLLVF